MAESHSNLLSLRCDAALTLHEQMRDHVGEVGRTRPVLRVADGVRDVRVVLEVGVDAVPAVREVDLPRVNMYHAVRRIKREESTQIEGTYLRSEILAIVGRDGGELRVCNCSVCDCSTRTASSLSRT